MTTAAIPADSLVAHALDRIDYADAFEGPAPSGVTNAEELARAIFAAPAPVWVRLLFGIRNAAARLVGLKAPPRHPSDTTPLDRDSLPLGKVYGRRHDEILFGLDDKHLDFRASVLLRGGRAIFATTVKFNGGLGRFYFALVRPFHGRIVRRMLTSARLRPLPSGT